MKRSVLMNILKVCTVLFISLSFFAAATAENTEKEIITKEEAASIIINYEKAAVALDHTNYNSQNAEILQMPFEARASIDGKYVYEYVPDCMAYVFRTERKTRGEWRSYLENVFTKEAAEIIIETSDLIFDNDDNAYLPNEPVQRFHPVVALSDTVSPITERITGITADEDGNIRIEFSAWRYSYETESNPETFHIMIRQTADGYRIYDFDDLFFDKDIKEIRAYRFLGQLYPNTSESAVYITAAAGVIALCLAVVCKKRLKTQQE